MGERRTCFIYTDSACTAATPAHFWTSIYPNEQLDIAAPLRTIMSSHDLVEVLLNSIGLGVSVILLTTLFALPLAWIMAKTDLGHHNWLDVVLLIRL